jgi:hypothetical protein
MLLPRGGRRARCEACLGSRRGARCRRPPLPRPSSPRPTSCSRARPATATPCREGQLDGRWAAGAGAARALNGGALPRPPRPNDGARGGGQTAAAPWIRRRGRPAPLRLASARQPRYPSQGQARAPPARGAPAAAALGVFLQAGPMPGPPGPLPPTNRAPRLVMHAPWAAAAGCQDGRQVGACCRAAGHAACRAARALARPASACAPARRTGAHLPSRARPIGHNARPIRSPASHPRATGAPSESRARAFLATRAALRAAAMLDALARRVRPSGSGRGRCGGAAAASWAARRGGAGRRSRTRARPALGPPAGRCGARQSRRRAASALLAQDAQGLTGAARERRAGAARAAGPPPAAGLQRQRPVVPGQAPAPPLGPWAHSRASLPLNATPRSHDAGVAGAAAGLDSADCGGGGGDAPLTHDEHGLEEVRRKGGPGRA